jgi:hypothetical protein
MRAYLRRAPCKYWSASVPTVLRTSPLHGLLIRLIPGDDPGTAQASEAHRHVNPAPFRVAALARSFRVPDALCQLAEAR